MIFKNGKHCKGVWKIKSFQLQEAMPLITGSVQDQARSQMQDPHYYRLTHSAHPLQVSPCLYRGLQLNVVLYQCEENKKSGDVSKHSAQWDLQWTEHLEGWHQVGRSSDAPDVQTTDSSWQWTCWWELGQVMVWPSCDMLMRTTMVDLQRTEHLEGWHQVGRSSNAPDVRQRKQHIRYDLWIIQHPVEPSCRSTQATPTTGSAHLALMNSPLQLLDTVTKAIHAVSHNLQRISHVPCIVREK